MTEVISVSCTRDDISNLQEIRKTKQMGATDVLRFGIYNIVNENKFKGDILRLNEQLEQEKKKSEKLYKIVQTLQQQMQEA